MVILGIIGLLLILFGRVIPDRKHLHITFAIGAFLLLIYSLYLRSVIFSLLNGILFIVDGIQAIRFGRKKIKGG